MHKLSPTVQVIEAAINDNKEKLFALLEKLEVLKLLKPEDKELTGEALDPALRRRSNRRRGGHVSRQLICHRHHEPASEAG